MKDKFFIGGAFSAALGVTLGAFGAHTLKSSLPSELLATFETGVRYQMYHAFGLMMTGLAPLLKPGASPRLIEASGWSFFAGTLLFSGSLYALGLSGARWLGAITPLGGVAFIAGWVLLGLALSKQHTTS
jgi:uncharacterized membrane protein YgdD (TMEM256/DUF423 family)